MIVKCVGSEGKWILMTCYFFLNCTEKHKETLKDEDLKKSLKADRSEVKSKRDKRVFIS